LDHTHEKENRKGALEAKKSSGNGSLGVHVWTGKGEGKRKGSVLVRGGKEGEKGRRAVIFRSASAG